jgi:hypothetical protein
MVIAPGSQSDTLWVKIEKMDTSASFPKCDCPVVIDEKVTPCPGDRFAASDNSKSVVRRDGTPVRRGPELGFEEIAIDLLQARFWITS